MNLASLERLAAAGIQLLPAVQLTSHFVLERDGFVALVERRGDNFGQIGSPGLFTDGGFAPLVRRGEHFAFVGKGVEQTATPEQVAAVRSFYDDLKNAMKTQ